MTIMQLMGQRVPGFWYTPIGYYAGSKVSIRMSEHLAKELITYWDRTNEAYKSTTPTSM